MKMRLWWAGVVACACVTAAAAGDSSTATNDLVVLASRRPGSSDGFKRFLRSAKIYGYNVEVLGGDKAATVSGTQRLKLLREAVQRAMQEDEERLVLYTESVDAVFSGAPVRVVEELEASGARLLVSADGFCWPDKTLEASYPKVERGKRFLNSGGFVGRAGTLHQLLTEEWKEDEEKKKEKVKDGEGKEEEEDDEPLQRLLSRVYVKDATRDKYKMKLDHLSALFQNLNGAAGDVEIRFAGREAYLQNTLYNTVPAVVRGNGHSALTLNSLASYLARSWNPEDGCRSCWDDMISLDEIEAADLPRVTLAVYVEKPTPFLQEFFDKLSALTYPTSRIDLYLHNAVEHHTELITAWLETEGPKYSSVKHIPAEENVKEWHVRNAAMDHCMEHECQHLFSVDSDALLDNPYILKLLIEQNREVVAPMLIRPYKAWSNFWGAITNDGFYARSPDYMEIVQSQRRGLWNVPFISACYLLNHSLVSDPLRRPSYIRNLLDPDMAFCENLREKGVFMYVSNRVDLGHLVNTESFDAEHPYGELWQVMDNRWDWEKRYIHPNYSLAVAENTTVEMPCPDVYWFPVFTERYAKEMIDTFEGLGTWSDGSHEARYDNTPPQTAIASVGMDGVWHEVLARWVAPMALKIFTGYNRYPPRALMSFMVRYKPDEQPFLRPHHDTSTYTINVALNKPGVDYEGGGCRFLRYNCSVTDSRVGWVLMHPGRLTHLHEGLPVTQGTRYIIVTFIDP